MIGSPLLLSVYVMESLSISVHITPEKIVASSGVISVKGNNIQVAPLARDPSAALADRFKTSEYAIPAGRFIAQIVAQKMAQVYVAPGTPMAPMVRIWAGPSSLVDMRVDSIGNLRIEAEGPCEVKGTSKVKMGVIIAQSYAWIEGFVFNRTLNIIAKQNSKIYVMAPKTVALVKLIESDSEVTIRVYKNQ